VDTNELYMTRLFTGI